MKKQPIFIANWKMSLAPAEEIALARKFSDAVGDFGGAETVICPSFLSLSAIASVFEKSGIQIGAQDVFWQNSGSYTGEISPAFLVTAGCRYAIIGHSERRQNLGETDEMVNRKIHACLDANITPIVCVGESRLERKNNHTDFVISAQLEGALTGVDLVGNEKIILAYEPIWAIGSGNAVEPEEAAPVLAVMKQTVVNLWPPSIAENNVRYIYGGSVDAENASRFRSLSSLNGFLIGGASLTVRDFVSIIKNFL